MVVVNVFGRFLLFMWLAEYGFPIDKTLLIASFRKPKPKEAQISIAKFILRAKLDSIL